MEEGGGLGGALAWAQGRVRLGPIMDMSTVGHHRHNSSVPMERMVPALSVFGSSIDPPCDIQSICGFFTGPWTVTRSSLRVLHPVAAFRRPRRPVLLLVSVSLLRPRCPVAGVLGLYWSRQVPFVCSPPSPPPPVGCSC